MGFEAKEKNRLRNEYKATFKANLILFLQCYYYFASEFAEIFPFILSVVSSKPSDGVLLPTQPLKYIDDV